MAKTITIKSAYTYRSGSRSQHANIDGVIDGYLFTFSQTLINGQVYYDLTQRVYRNGCPSDRKVPMRGKFNDRYNALILAFKALPQYVAETGRPARAA